MLGCSGDPPVTAAPVASENSRTDQAEAAPAQPSSGSTTVWLHRGPEIVGLVGDAAYYWDSEMSDAGGIVSLAIADGRLLAKQPIRGSNVNGMPSYWLPGSGDEFIAAWDETPMLLAPDQPSAKLEAGASADLQVRWKGPTGRWGEAIIVGEKLILWDYAPRQAVVAFSTVTGAELWQAPLVREANGVSLDYDGESVIVVWQQYSATAPTPTVTIAQRVRALDPETGTTRWAQDFKEHTGGIAAAGDTLLVAKDADLLFLRGKDRALVKKIATGHSPTIYPSFAVGEERVFVGLRDAVTAYDPDTGEVQWRHPIEVNAPAMAISGEHVLVSGTHELVALERTTGTPAWKVSIGIRPYRIEANERGVVAIGGLAVGFSLPAHFEPERATLSGRVELRCVEPDKVTVQVGPVTTKLDNEGRYAAIVETAGLLLVSAMDTRERFEESRPRAPAAEFVPLTGAGTYDVPTIILDRCEG